MCIKPYVDRNKVALEIGCGRGAWSKCMTGFGKLFCVDPVPPDTTGFWNHVGQHNNVFYERNLTLSFLPDYGVDYVFSFGTFCHLPFEAVQDYADRMHRKIQAGANCFWMISDADKYRRSTGRGMEELMGEPGGWHDNNLGQTLQMLMNIGYTIISPDVGSCLRDPIVHFTR
jgi:hypothetical protein